MKTGTKIALWITGIAVVSVGGYFIWKSIKKAKKDKEEEKKVVMEVSAVKDILSKPLSQLIPNTQPKGFGVQSGGFTKPNLINRSASSIYQPLNLNLPNRV